MLPGFETSVPTSCVSVGNMRDMAWPARYMYHSRKDFILVLKVASVYQFFNGCTHLGSNRSYHLTADDFKVHVYTVYITLYI